MFDKNKFELSDINTDINSDIEANLGVIFKGKQYELTDTSEIKKENKCRCNLLNLINPSLYILLIFTILITYVSISIMVGAINLKNDVNNLFTKIDGHIDDFEIIVNYFPVNMSDFINGQMDKVVNVTELLIDKTIMEPKNFIEKTVNGFSDGLSIIIPNSNLSKVNLELNIGEIEIGKVKLDKLNMEVPFRLKKVFGGILGVITDIPYYIGISLVLLSVILILIVFMRSIVLVLDYRSRWEFCCALSFWIGLIIGIFFMFCGFVLVFVNNNYIVYVNEELTRIDNSISGNISIYNDGVDKVAFKINEFINMNLEKLVEHTNRTVEELRKITEETVNKILLVIPNSSINIPMANIAMGEYVDIDLDKLKIDPNLIQLKWIANLLSMILRPIIIIIFIVGIIFNSLAIVTVVSSCVKAKQKR
jgi:hypothetical protein